MKGLFKESNNAAENKHQTRSGNQKQKNLPIQRWERSCEKKGAIKISSKGEKDWGRGREEKKRKEERRREEKRGEVKRSEEERREEKTREEKRREKKRRPEKKREDQRKR